MCAFKFRGTNEILKTQLEMTEMWPNLLHALKGNWVQKISFLLSTLFPGLSSCLEIMIIYHLFRIEVYEIAAHFDKTTPDQLTTEPCFALRLKKNH